MNIFPSNLLKPSVKSAEEVEALLDEGKVDKQDVIYFFFHGYLKTGKVAIGLAGDTANAADEAEQFHQFHLAYKFLFAAALICGAIATYMVYQSSQTQIIPSASIAEFNDAVIPVSERAANFNAPSVRMSQPNGWQAVEVRKGVTAYVPPTEAIEVVQPTAPSNATATVPGLDGTRKPYVTNLRFADLTPNPARAGLYSWSGVWEGEGYTREVDRDQRLVADREGGKDIFLVVTYDKTITDPKQPNLRITIRNMQDVTGQLTNLSAFLMEPGTGQAIARQDFEQLPPQYDVTVAFNSRFDRMETKTLMPLGEQVFSYHVAPEDIEKEFPLKLQAENQFFEQRLWEIYNLQSEGWIVKEVPQA